MRRINLGGALAAAAFIVAGSAGAVAQPVPAHSWTGFYVGGHVGGARGDYDFAVNAAPGWNALVRPFIERDGSRALDSNGIIGGAQFGYNWQTNKVVVGFETDVSALSAKKTFDTGLLPSAGVGAFSQFQYEAKINWLATLRARMGLAVRRDWLIYVTGGLALGEVQSSFSHVRPASGYISLGTERTTKFGWTVGGGLEYALHGPWAIKAEYLYVDLGTVDYQTAWTVTPVFYETVSMDTHLHIARIGMSYRFAAPR